MMVTFVSECEKKALNRTRRVLDAFANRIGSRTWQTVITQEGLIAVKKLLRKTATKNTAVSCHWIRSRSRSEFLWVVGNKDNFNEQGIVSVNYTNQINALKMDELNVNIETYYANTEKQPLVQHLFAVGFVAYELMKKLTLDTELPKESFIAGCWHDMGKVEPKFQKGLLDGFKKGFSWNTNPRHNEISSMLYHSLSDEVLINNSRIEHAIYWHHAKPIRKKDIEKYIWIYDKVSKDYKNMLAVIDQIIKSINAISQDYFDEKELTLAKINYSKFSDLEDILENKTIPEYKSYSRRGDILDYSKRITDNAKNNLIRTVITTADQLVSKLTSEELVEHVSNKTLFNIVDDALLRKRVLKQHIRKCLDWFSNEYPLSERNLTQTEKAKELADEEINIGVLRGAAGCGKTKIALEWAFNTNAKKIFWVCPRVQVCQGLFHDLTQYNYLPDAEIEICTGEIKEITQSGNTKYENTPAHKIFSGDVVITTIDQIINSITTHKQITSLVEYLNAHVVFDEFHEYIHMPGFNLLFAELVKCKELQQTDDSLPNTLLVSATPNPLYVEKLLKIHKNNISTMPSFNTSKYQFKFLNYDDKDESESNPFYSPQPHNKSFVISNTALTAQKSFIDNQQKENSILLHANYKKGDRETLFSEVFNCFKQNGNNKYDLLRSGPIVQASLNISCDYMVNEIINAENTLQRLGRLDRFGENSTVNMFVIAITDKVISGKQHVNRFLANTLFCLQSTKAWYEFLQAEDVEKKVMSINDIYQLYAQFYDTPHHVEMVEQDLASAINEGIDKLALFLTPPIEYRNKSKKKELVQIKKNSLRGNSRFVQMAQCKVLDRNNPEILNEYAFECAPENNDVMTWDVSRIEGYTYSQKDSKKDLLAFMAQKHHQILKYKTDSKIIDKNDSTYKKEALNPDTPIFVSYTPEDLAHLGPSTKAKPNAIYYVIGKNQAIGALSLTDLKPQGK